MNELNKEISFLFVISAMKQKYFFEDSKELFPCPPEFMTINMQKNAAGEVTSLSFPPVPFPVTPLLQRAPAPPSPAVPQTRHSADHKNRSHSLGHLCR